MSGADPGRTREGARGSGRNLTHELGCSESSLTLSLAVKHEVVPHGSLLYLHVTPASNCRGPRRGHVIILIPTEAPLTATPWGPLGHPQVPLLT